MPFSFSFWRSTAHLMIHDSLYATDDLVGWLRVGDL